MKARQAIANTKPPARQQVDGTREAHSTDILLNLDHRPADQTTGRMMEIEEDDILRNVAAGGSMDFSAWPALLPRVVSRIEKVEHGHIAHDDFPIPTLPPPPSTTITIPSSIPHPTNEPGSETTANFLSPLPSSPTEPASSSSSQDTNKENTPVAQRTAAPPTSVPARAAPLPPGTLPPQVAHMLSEITSTLTSTFPTNPPHTLQRLSELVLAPKGHYRSLTNYLHALDRVVRVTSSLDIYPLPLVHAESTAALPNGDSDMAPAPSLWAAPGSDEALGGALLTPIPWLQASHQGIGGGGSPQPQHSPPTATTSETPGPANDLEGEVRTESTETIDGPNGVGSIETVSVSVNGIPSMGARGVGVTQGELLRQEQRAGVVPVSQLVPTHRVHTGHPGDGSGASAAAAQQVQARIHHAQVNARSGAPPDSSTSTSASSSTPSSATLEEEEDGRGQGEAAMGSTSEPATTGEAAANAPVSSINSTGPEDEERPHARGPEEIGSHDVGPQSASNTSTIDGPGGIEMQGIDLQAAVGRKAVAVPTDESSTSTAPGTTERAAKTEQQKPQEQEEDDGDKMDVEVEALTTPKREAEDQLASAASKKLKEDPEAAATGAGGEKHGKGEEDGDGDKGDADAMDKDE
ncbi:Uu.00g027590.m01.CDS01 [Anthostomella pinea]|uniref:Uu.00g027590.m01.CDS01 n=1 Tax=Anthostomella pinea TaxID=933095 RepID=A0AAI8YCM1_9PEZI|nr:Uu.00g027590.m01.CDS01 [Anthostomella pinea]